MTLKILNLWASWHPSMGARFLVDPIFWQKVLLGHQNKGSKWPSKRCDFLWRLRCQRVIFFYQCTVADRGIYASDHELYGNAAAAHNSIADQCEVFFLMRTRLGITIVGGGRGRACVCDGSTLYTKIMYPPLAIAPSHCGIILHRLMSLDTSLVV